MGYRIFKDVFTKQFLRSFIRCSFC